MFRVELNTVFPIRAVVVDIHFLQKLQVTDPLVEKLIQAS
jgi:hypothetical protein